jgi:hypothetical protein
MRRIQRSLELQRPYTKTVWCRQFNFSVTFLPTDKRANWSSGTVRRIWTADVTRSVPGLHGSVDVGCCVVHVGRDVTTDEMTGTDVIRGLRNAHSKRSVCHPPTHSPARACKTYITVVVTPHMNMFCRVAGTKKNVKLEHYDTTHPRTSDTSEIL